MSKKLALSSALSVLLMAGYALIGQQTLSAATIPGSSALFPARAELPALPALPQLPFQR